METWRAIPGYECYEASTEGRIRRAYTHVGKLTAEQRESLRADRAAGMVFKDLASKYGISHRAAVLAIRQRKFSFSTPNRIMSARPNTHGYVAVTLCINNKVITRSVHRLMALAFLGPIPEKIQVNHKNGIKSDNRLENLELVTRSQNALHSVYVLGKQPRTDHLQAFNAERRAAAVAARG